MAVKNTLTTIDNNRSPTAIFSAKSSISGFVTKTLLTPENAVLIAFMSTFLSN